MENKPNILKDIKELIFPAQGDYLSIRDGHRAVIDKFLTHPVLETAKELYNFIQKIHKKEGVFTYMDDLRLYEKTLLAILPEQRDHYLHSASVYVLGLAIYNSISKIRNSVKIDHHPPESDSQKTSFLFRWSLAACLHDIAYPLELTLKSFNKYSTKLHEIEKDGFSFVEIDRDLYDRFNLLPILKPNEIKGFEKMDTALGLISYRLVNDGTGSSRISYDTLLKIIEKYYESNLKKGRIDHGAFSAVILLNRIHNLYEHKNWPTEDFYYEIVDAATAIFLHNAYRYSLLKQLFGDGVFRYDSPSSLGYLLYLCDSLCEWLRGRNRDAHHFGINIQSGNIIYRAPKKAKKNIEKAMELFDNRIPVSVTYEN